MKLSVSKTAKLSGVSVRTLHYYDKIGLLAPSEVTESGYRYYDDQALERLQQILFYRELDFPLKSIVDILNASDYKKEEALQKQKELLMLKRKRLDGLIELLECKEKGVRTMSFHEFDTKEIDLLKEKYSNEVIQRWGKTDAYKQSDKKTAQYKKEDWSQIMDKSDELLKKFAEKRNLNPAEEEVQTLVGEWRAFITENYYDCTNEILGQLGEMYVADERFTENIDKFGNGTAEFMHKAISAFCSK